MAQSKRPVLMGFFVFSFVLVFVYTLIHLKLVELTLMMSKLDIFDRFHSLHGFPGAISKHAKLVSWGESGSMKFIILAMTDNSFTDMAMNLYLSSFKRFNIQNFLFVGGGKNACHNLNKLQIQCFDFRNDPSSNESSVFASKEFIRKMNIRTEMILAALHAGFSVLHTDLDVAFLKNPMPEIEDLLKNNSMAILWDYLIYNAGFLAIKATPFSINVYTRIQNMTNASSTQDDQGALNNVLNEINKNQSSNKSYKAPVVLDKKRFLCGREYYIWSRYFPSENMTEHCSECVVVHNNWIVSKEAKVFRFQETSMWHVDEGGYYSDPKRRYLLYHNPRIKEPPGRRPFNVKDVEIRALRAAFKVAYVLNRTLILPRFNCDKNFQCPLNSWFTVKPFHKQFYPGYRESSFLLSPLVPESIRMRPIKDCNPSGDWLFQKIPRWRSLAQCNRQDTDPRSKCRPFNPVPILIVTNTTADLMNATLTSFPASEILDLTELQHLNETTLLDAFGRCSDQVLVLTSLLGVEVKFSNPKSESTFEQRLNAGFVGGVYAQINF